MSWVLGVFLLLGFLFGWRKGLLRIVSGMVGLIVELYVAFHFNEPMRGIIDQYTGFTDRVTLFLSEHFPVAEFVASFPVEFLPKSTAAEVDKIISAPVQAVSALLLYVLSFILLFFLTKLIFRIAGQLLTGSLDHTFMGPVNRFLGGLLGVLFAALVVGIGLTGFSWILGDWNLPGDHLGTFPSLIHQSPVAEFLRGLF